MRLSDNVILLIILFSCIFLYISSPWNYFFPSPSSSYITQDKIILGQHDVRNSSEGPPPTSKLKIWLSTPCMMLVFDVVRINDLILFYLITIKTSINRNTVAIDSWIINTLPTKVFRVRCLDYALPLLKGFG